jgi:Flp pilus assembly protein TadD
MRALYLALALALVTASGCGARQPSAAETRELLDKDSPYAFYRALAHTMVRTRQYQRATPHIRTMMRMRPGDAEPLYLLARVYAGMGIYETASTTLKAALELDADYLPAIALLGVTNDHLGRHAEAERWHRKALALQPTSVSVYNNLGFCLYLQGRYREARNVYLRALRYQPGDRRLHNNLALAYGRTGDLDNAIRHFRLAGSDASVASNMGLVYESRGDLEAAYRQYVIALAADPTLAEARGNLERVCGRLGRPVPDLGPTEDE